MATSGTLYTYPNSFRAQKALIAAQYSGAKLDLAKNFKLGETNKTPEFLSKFPLGKVPAFESSKGDRVFESNAIAHLVANEQLRGGKNAVEQAQVLQWSSFADSEILPASSAWVFPLLGAINMNKTQSERGQSDLKRSLAVLNQHLLTRTYLVGERITLADINVATTLLLAYQHVLTPSVRGAYPNVNRWFTTLINQPQFKKVLGNVQLCEVETKPDAQAKKQSGGGDEQKKKDKKEKAPKEAKAAPKAKAKEEPEDTGENDFPELVQPKQKDPFEAFPKGNFDMDDFKRFYSNNEEKVAIPYFWQKFDPEHYSIWYCEYKYPEELTMIFMSCNLMSGMMQRLDKMRKNAFGSMILFGENNNSSISGIWFWRGPELAFTLSDDWQVDYESYSWTKLDPKDPKTKELVDAYLLAEGTINGKVVNQGKIFK